MQFKRTTSGLIVSLLIAVGCMHRAPNTSHLTPQHGKAVITASTDGGTHIYGVVFNEGTQLPGATVTISCTSLQGVRTAVSNVNGEYAFTGLAPGDCTVKTELSGMQTVQKRVHLEAGQTARMDADLKLSSASQTITVTAASPRTAALESTEVQTNIPNDEGRYVARKSAPPVSIPPAPPSESLYLVNGAVVNEKVKSAVSGLGGVTAITKSGDVDAEAIGTEQYAKIAENEFHETKEESISTFSSDVDTASYTNIRRILLGGSLPPKDAVRIEEMLNYFHYDDPAPKGKAPFAVSTEVASCPWERSHQLLRIGLRSQAIDISNSAPHNFVFLIDVSGSMYDADKLPLVKKSFELLLEQMRGQDRVAIVTYAGHEGLLMPSTPGTNKELLRHAIEGLEAGGSTAGAAGITLAYQIAQENFIKGGNNRVILATDGDFNVGVSSEKDLEDLIVSERDKGIFLTTLGYGAGNLKDEKLELLADKGNGNYFYVDSADEAKKLMVNEMGGSFVTVAKDVKLQVVFDPSSVKKYRLIGYENRMLKTEDFENDKKDAGDVGSGQSVTALYEVETSGGASQLGEVKIRYKEPQGSKSALLQFPISGRSSVIEAATTELRFSAAVAELGLLLRQSEHKGNASYAEVVSLAQTAIGVDLDKRRDEFVQLAKKAQSIAAPAITITDAQLLSTPSP